MKSRQFRNHYLLAAALTTLVVGVCGPLSQAATLHHQDGTIVHGKIVHETPEEIKIETQYGRLNYLKEELTQIDREETPGAATAIATTPVPKTDPAAPGGASAGMNYTALIPAGPVDPLNPPRLPFLVQYGIGTKAAAGQSTAPAVATPVAPQMTPVVSAGR